MTGRKKLSGYQYRKQALLKDKKNDDIVKKCKNIQNMFNKKTVESKYINA